jgi:hypothetical protein
MPVRDERETVPELLVPGFARPGGTMVAEDNRWTRDLWQQMFRHELEPNPGRLADMRRDALVIDWNPVSGMSQRRPVNQPFMRARIRQVRLHRMPLVAIGFNANLLPDGVRDIWVDSDRVVRHGPEVTYQPGPMPK